MPSHRAARRLFIAWAFVATALVATLFYAGGRAASGGAWPAPLDDVYIHYDFARSIALGHPFEWIPGQGYSSGETSPAYAIVLALGYAAGFRGGRIGYWAALVACGSLVVIMICLARAVTQRIGTRPRRAWPMLLVAPLLLASGTLDFAWFSGMEVALFGAVAAALLLAVDNARRADASTRTMRQWQAGALGALLVLVRPEAAVVVAMATFVVARSVGASSPMAGATRVALPGALVTLSVATLNWFATGTTASAGAALKLLSSNPFTADEDRAREYVVNLFSIFQALQRDLGTADGHLAYVFPLLALVSLSSRRTRAPGVLCLGGAVAYTLLVSWNGAARYQNFRDYMPPVALLLFAAAFGLTALVGSRHAVVRFVGVGLTLLGVGLGGSHVAEAAQLYARASRNIHEQQVTVGARLGRDSPEDAIVLVGDAGAIPYVSGLHAIDALGLGGYHRLPFVRAAVHGEAATLELIERLPTRDRPTLLALYPNWFPGMTGHFGHLRGEVTIEDNVICGGVTKGIYDADWSGLRGDHDVEDLGADVLDEVDIADIVSEEAHEYRSPAPRGGWTLFDVRPDPRAGVGARFDAGRIVPQGEEESFRVTTAAPAGSTLLLRIDTSLCEVEARVVGEVASSATLSVRRLDESQERTPSWRYAEARLMGPVIPGDRIHLRVLHGSLHDFHVWLLATPPGKP